jgi:hypothetical protein
VSVRVAIVRLLESVVDQQIESKDEIEMTLSRDKD